MRKLLLLAVLVWCLPVSAAKKEPKSLSQQMEDKKYFYTALNEFFKETYFRPITKDDVSKLEELLYYTGIEILDDYDPSMLARFPASSTRFILGRLEMQRKRTKAALSFFDKVHEDHRYYPETKLLVAQLHWNEGRKDESFKAVNECLKSAEKNEKNAENEKIKRYYRMAYEICLVNKARNLYKTGEYDAALEAYGKIPKVSYKWPYILLEKAWVYYHKGDFNRALGQLLAYKSPLMDTYFFPEAEYLAALAYFRLCLYEDSLIMINHYYRDYRPRFAALEQVLRKNVNSHNFFYNLMFKENEDLKHEVFVRHIMTRLKKEIRFSLDFNTVHKLNLEMQAVNRTEKGKIRDKMLAHLGEVRENMVNKINYNAKTSIFEFLQSVPFFSSELFKLNLEIISRKKDLVYSNRELAKDRNRGDFSNVQRSRFEMFWTFQGEFWADELGDYSLGLQDSCKTQRREEVVKEDK